MSRNSLLPSFIRTLEERFAPTSTDISMSQWLSAHTSLRNRPFSYTDYEFQRRIVDDMHPNLAVIKLSQVGLTEVQFRKFFGFLRRHAGTTGIFTLPTDQMRDRTSQTRVKPMIDSEEVFNPPGVDKPIRQKGVYQVGTSYGYLTGSTEKDATSIPADILFNDELDLTDQQMVALFQSRLQNSSYKITQRFSTPTYVGYGIDGLYTLSDQHEFLYKCPHCNTQQIPTFEPPFVALPGLKADVEDLATLSQEQILAIDHESAHWRCGHCSKPLDLHDPSLREWVPKYPGRATRGYRVRPTSTSRISVPYILTQLSEYSRLDNLRGFRNTVLGEPDNTADARLPESEIRANMQSPAQPEISPDTPCLIGIDVGITTHVILATFDTTICFRQIPHNQLAEEIKLLKSRYNIVAGAIDRYPDVSLSETIRDITDSIIIPIHYAGAPNAPSMKEVFDVMENLSYWSCHRTTAIDYAVALVRKQILKFNGYGSFAPMIVSHLRDMVRIENPDTPAVWNKLTGQDHWFHALTYVGIARKSAEINFQHRNDDLRTHCFVLPSASSKQPSLSPSSLNKITHGSFPQI